MVVSGELSRAGRGLFEFDIDFILLDVAGIGDDASCCDVDAMGGLR